MAEERNREVIYAGGLEDPYPLCLTYLDEDNPCRCTLAKCDTRATMVGAATMVLGMHAAERKGNTAREHRDIKRRTAALSS